MEYKISEGLASLKPSIIREILKETGGSSTIPFAAGNPAPDAFPVDDVKEIIGELFENNPVLALQYGVTDGFAPLVAELEKLCRERYNVMTADDSVIVTSGAQQVMSLLSHALLNHGDTVICEEPAFIGALNCFRSFGAKLVGVPLEADGMNIAALEQAFINNPGAKFLYTIPNFQNPAGSTTSFEKRKAIYELAKRFGVVILEDNPYGETRVAGEDIPAIKTLDDCGLVVYSGSFSKIVAPGIRVGFVCANKALIAKMTVVKQTQDVHTPIMSQYIVYKWLHDYDYEAHIAKIKSIYRRKLNLMCDLIDKELGDYVEYVRPQGGLFVWCKLDDRFDMLTFVKKASAAGVAIVPGNAFLCDESGTTQYVRLNFSTPSDEGIVKGMKILGEVARNY
ncbi:MAG: PLP-dependent aminotransferase family protein [Clostridia bacterium]|nr:PLP-dependent aminotransferase family protein [Clostridia bacterium]